MEPFFLGPGATKKSRAKEKAKHLSGNRGPYRQGVQAAAWPDGADRGGGADQENGWDISQTSLLVCQDALRVAANESAIKAYLWTDPGGAQGGEAGPVSAEREANRKGGMRYAMEKNAGGALL